MDNTSLTTLLVLGYATYMLALTLARLDGPFGLAASLRGRVYEWRGYERFANEDLHAPEWIRISQEVPHWLQGMGFSVYSQTLDDDWIAGGISCPICLGFWIGIPMALVCGMGLIQGLAVAGLAGWLFAFTQRG